jgi:putative glycosyltransferase (TIGR04372 family)
MGDNSMKPLPPMERVVDYAHSTAKCEIGDILIAAACKLFIGTNSGYATIPGIYGVPCVLTNWVPIALPLWFGQDLMIPKMFWDTTKSDYVGFEQIFSTPLGATQNTHDFPPGIGIRNNTPEEIDEVVQEMLDRLDGVATYTAEDQELQDRYLALAIKYGSYKSSRIGREFMNKYRSLLPETFVISPQLQIAAS